MTFFPDGFDARAPVMAMLDLLEIDTAEGTFGFMPGVDGIFQCCNGRTWYGSALATIPAMQSPIDGIAPEVQLTLSFFQDPGDPELIDQLRALGADYVKGREVRFYVQPIRSHEEFMAPTLPPIRWDTRIMRSLEYAADGAQGREITLTCETVHELRSAARRIVLNTEGHAILAGGANPSLEFMPTVDFEPEKLFG